MDILSFLKFVHVVAAVAWVGGALSFVVLSNLLTLRGDREGALSVVSLTAPLGAVWFLPAALTTVLSGLTLFFLGGWPLDGWSVTALGLVAVAFAIGATRAMPVGNEVARLIAKGDRAGAMEAAAPLAALGRFDAACMVAIVALMVLKPSFGDLAVLGTVVGAVGLVGFFTFTSRPVAA